MEEATFNLLFFLMFFLALFYLKTVFDFFAELKNKDPQLWKDIGSPELKTIFTNQNLRLFSFFSILLKCAKDPEYKYPKRALFLLAVFLPCFFLLIFSHFYSVIV